MSRSNSARRDVLKQSSGTMATVMMAVLAIVTACADVGSPHAAVAADEVRDPPRFQYLGWQVGLSYQAPRPEGKRPEELRSLIREMEANSMNLLSIMLVSYSRFDDHHDGFCWPTRRKSLRCYRYDVLQRIVRQRRKPPSRL